MNAVTRFVAVVFGPHPRHGGWLGAPGDADCRWRVIRSFGRRGSKARDERAPMPGPPIDEDAPPRAPDAF